MCYQLCARSKAVTESSLKEIFSYFDTNESGDIDRYELEALLDFFHLPRSEYTADGIMARLDVNHDGVLSEEEWLNFMLREMEPPMSGIPGDPLHISVRYYAACSRYSRQGESMWMKLYAWLAKDDARKARALRNYRDLHWWNDLNTARQLFVVAVVCFCAHAAWRYAATLFHLVHALVSSDAAAAAAAAAAAPNGTGGDALGGASLEQQAAAILLMPLIVFGSTQLVSVFVPDGHESSVKWVTLTLALVMYQTISMWSQTVSFDKSISISALDLSLGEILIFTAVVDHFQKMRETQVEKKEQMQDWVEHAADRRRVNVSLNTIDARGNLALRTLREQSLYEVFPSKHVADRLIDAAEEIDPGVQARAPSGALIVIAKGKLFTQAKQTHKRLVDQLTNYVSSINGSGFIDKDCGAPALEVNYVFGLTFEKEVNRKSAANEKFKILLVREDLLAKAHLKGDDEIADPLMHPMAQAYFKKRWRQLQDMADYYFDRETPLSPQARKRKRVASEARSRSGNHDGPLAPPAKRRSQLLLMSTKSKPLVLVAKGQRVEGYSVPWSDWGAVGATRGAQLLAPGAPASAEAPASAAVAVAAAAGARARASATPRAKKRKASGSVRKVVTRSSAAAARRRRR